MYDYDLLVIGSGPGGQKAAIAAAKLDRRVAVVERPEMLGGVCVNTGTIPSKTLREAILYLTGIDQREIYGQSYRVKDEITVADLTARTSHVVSRENDVVRSQLARNRVTIIQGLGYFVGPNAVEVDDGGGRIRKVTADKIVIATGTKPARPASVAFDEQDDHRLRRHEPPGQGAPLDGGGRRGRDRHGVRVHVRRPRHQGHRGREARRACSSSATRRSSRRSSTTCGTSR